MEEAESVFVIATPSLRRLPDEYILYRSHETGQMENNRAIERTVDIKDKETCRICKIFLLELSL